MGDDGELRDFPLCPKCGKSDMIDVCDLEHDIEYFHCDRCGIWFDEYGRIDENGSESFEYIV